MNTVNSKIRPGQARSKNERKITQIHRKLRRNKEENKRYSKN
jgi:hypothetical protein